MSESTETNPITEATTFIAPSQPKGKAVAKRSSHLSIPSVSGRTTSPIPNSRKRTIRLMKSVLHNIRPQAEFREMPSQLAGISVESLTKDQ
jgi:hypothetical protein